MSVIQERPRLSRGQRVRAGGRRGDECCRVSGALRDSRKVEVVREWKREEV